MRIRLLQMIACGAVAMGGCHHDRDTDSYNSSNGSRDSEYSSRDADGDWSSPDARILSILHAKNLEEMQAGQLAQERGQSDEVRQYGRQLVQDHSDSDRRVMEVARGAMVTMTDPDEMKSHMKDRKADKKDALDELRQLNGSEFDRTFVQRMHEGHEKLIAKVKAARSKVHDAGVRALLDDTLPVLQRHENSAESLMDKTGK